MRSGPDQQSRGRLNGNRPPQRQQGSSQRSQIFDSNGPGVRIRGAASQIYERYIALAREAATSDDRVAVENFYQHAEHYLRIDNMRRENHQQGMPPRPATRADVEMKSSEGSTGAQAGR